MLSVGALTSNLNIVTKTANYTAAANEFVVASAASGAITITMPTAPYLNAVVAVKKSDATTNAVTIVPGGTATLNGDTSALLAVTGASATFQYDGTNWQLLSTGTINTAASAAGLPSGGTSGQVLTKSSATNYDVGWTAAAAPGGVILPSWAPGLARFYAVPPVMSQPASIVPQYSTTYQIFYLARVPYACTVSSISVTSTNANSGATVYVGVYTDAPSATSQGPGVRLGGGNAVVAASAYQATTIATSFTISQPQNIWLSLGLSSSVALVTHEFLPTSFMSASTSMFFSGSNLTANGAYNAKYSTSYGPSSSTQDVSGTSMPAIPSACPVFYLGCTATS